MTRPSSEYERFRVKSGATGAHSFSVAPIPDHLFVRRPLGPDERDYAFSLDAWFSWVIVRKLGRHWVIRETYRSVVR